MIICIALFIILDFRAHRLLKYKNSDSAPVTLDTSPQTFNVCTPAVKLLAFSKLIALIGFIGCVWPFYFMKGLEWGDRNAVILYLGIVPVLVIAYIFYLDLKGSRGYLKINSDRIEYKRVRSFSVNVSDIKKVIYPGGFFEIHLKEKRKRPFHVTLTGFHNPHEICSLMNQLADYTANATGRENHLHHKLYPWKLKIKAGRYAPLFFKALIILPLLYTSYCCIDYNFFKKDYTALYNSLNADPAQSQNAWPHYVNAAVNYKEIEYDFQQILNDSLESGKLELTDEQFANLQKWNDDNKSSWTSFKKAVSIDYCNAYYDNISFINNNKHDDFSSPFNTSYSHIGYLCINANASRLVEIRDIPWIELFQMQISASKHLVEGKSFIDRYAGYSMLVKSIQLLSGQKEYSSDNLETIREILKIYYPENLPPLNIEGEIFIWCGIVEDFIKLKGIPDFKNNTGGIPIQTPLNPMYLLIGSISGTEQYTRKHYDELLENTRKGIRLEPSEFSIFNFPIMRKCPFLHNDILKVYEISKRTNANLQAAYTILDLEQYNLDKGTYPADFSQLTEAGFTSKLPDDPDSDTTIIYRNDGKTAILYAVGKNAIDDGGHKDKTKAEGPRDDRIYWQRNLTLPPSAN